MSMTNEDLISRFAVAVKDFHRSMDRREAKHKDYREALAQCQNHEAEYTEIRRELLKRMDKGATLLAHERMAHSEEADQG